MVKRKNKRYAQGTSIHVSENLYEGAQEMVSVITNLAGITLYQEPFMTLSDTILTLTSFSVQVDDVMARGSNYLVELMDNANRETPALTVSINYNESQKTIIEKLMSRYSEIGFKTSFGEAIRIALYHAIDTYQKEPYKILVPIMLLTSVAESSLTTKNSYEQADDVLSFRFPELTGHIKEVVKTYYSGLPDYFTHSILDKGKPGYDALNELTFERMKIEIAKSSRKESVVGQTMHIRDRAISDVTALSYIAYILSIRSLNDQIMIENINSVDRMDQISSVYSSWSYSFTAYSMLTLMPIFQSSLVSELNKTMNTVIKPFFLSLIKKVF